MQPLERGQGEAAAARRWGLGTAAGAVARAAGGAARGVWGWITGGRKREREGGAEPGGTKKAKTGDG